MLDLACNGYNNISMLDIRGFILFHIYFISTNFDLICHLDSVIVILQQKCFMYLIWFQSTEINLKYIFSCKLNI